LRSAGATGAYLRELFEKLPLAKTVIVDMNVCERPRAALQTPRRDAQSQDHYERAEYQ